MNKIYIYMLEEVIPWEGENVSGILYSPIYYTEDKIMKLIRNINEKVNPLNSWLNNEKILEELEKYEIYPVRPIVIDSYLKDLDLPWTFGDEEYIDLDKLKGV